MSTFPRATAVQKAVDNPAKQKVLETIFGRWRSQILYAGVSLGIFEKVTEKSASAAEVAAELGLDAALCYRLMRALGALELLEEDSQRRFRITPAGELLRKDHPESLRGITLLEEGPEHYAIWKYLPDMVRDGRQNAFLREFGRHGFEHTNADEHYRTVFDEAMSSYSQTQAAWVMEALQKYDFWNISHLCDVGGGHGHLLCAFLQRYPHLRGTVFERATVLADRERLWGHRLGLWGRCDYVAGDMFDSVPRADAYLMKLILHDWNDQECVQILSNLHRSAQEGGRVFLVEHIVPEPGQPHFAKLFDIHMMCWGTGRERTSEEYATLLDQAGWKYVQTWFPESRVMGIVEGVKARPASRNLPSGSIK